MAVNYATKYSSNVDEKFTKESIVAGAINQDYDWEGTTAIKVYSVGTSALNDYTLTGTNRYGTPAELDNEVQTMVLSQDKSFTFTIDKKSQDDTVGVMEAGKALAREIREVVVPTIDKYVLQRMVNAVGSKATGAIKDFYGTFLDATNALDDADVPSDGRICYVSSAFRKGIMLDSNFIKSGDLSQNMLITGQIGEVDGVAIVKAGNRLPAGVDFIMTHPIATTYAMKLEEYKVHDDAPGISGSLVEGRIRYDAFVRKNKKNAIYVHSTSSITADDSAKWDSEIPQKAKG